MRVAVLFVFLFGVGIHAQEKKVSVRDVGFTDLEVEPYRLVILAKDPEGLSIKKLEADLKKELEHTPMITLAVHATDKRPEPLTKLPQLKKGAEASFWLIARDRRMREFNPKGMPELLKSPLREDLETKLPHALATVVLFESKDEDANRRAREKADRVVQQINRVQHQFEKGADHGVEVVTVPVGQRGAERWTLWALGDDDAPPAAPKIIVFYGKMRQAGDSFDGTRWKDADLFARIAILGQEWDGDARTIVAGPMLPFAWTNWPDAVAGTLGFDPVADAPKIKAILDQPPLKDRQRKLRFEDYPVELPRAIENNNVPPLDPPARPEPPWISTTPVGVAFLIVGVLGWIALGVSVLMLEQRPEPNRMQ